MRRALSVWTVLAFLGAAGSWAHHSGAMFEPVKAVEFEGTVREFQWTNPHSWLQILKPTDAGTDEEWSLELGPLVGLARAGWKPHSLQPGDKVIVDGLLNATPGQMVSAVDETQSFVVASSAN